jgi:endoglucanase
MSTVCSRLWAGAALALCLLQPLAAEVNWGVNLAGAEFGDPTRVPGVHGQDYWYPNGVGEPKSLQYYASKNLKLVRFPIKWERVQRTLGGALDATEMARVHAFVDEANSLGMKVILDIHNYCRYRVNGSYYRVLGTSALTDANLADLWRRLALEFRNKNLFAYDLMNEPHGLASGYGSPAGQAIWKNAAQATINAIRTVDTATPIMISGYEWSQATAWVTLSDSLRTLSDSSNKLIFQAHQYMDKNQSGTYENNGNFDFSFHAGTNTQVGSERLKPFIDWLRKYNLKGFVGETSVPGNNQSGWNTALRNMLETIKDADDVLVGFTYWAGGPRWPTSTPNWSHIEPYNNRSFPNDITKWTDRPQMAAILAATGGKATHGGSGGGGTPPAQSVACTAPASAVRGTAQTINVTYSAAASDRRLAVMLFSISGSTWTYQTGSFPAVNGNGTMAVTLTVPAACPTGAGIWQVLLQNAAGTTTYEKVEKNLTITAAPTGPVQTPFLGTPTAIPGTLQAENFDLGGQGVAYNDTTSGNRFGSTASRGTESVDTTGGVVGFTANGEWLEYTVTVATTGTYDVVARVGVKKSGAQLSVAVDGTTRIDRKALPVTGDYGTFQNVPLGTMQMNADTRVLRLTINKDGYNIDRLVFTALPSGNG